MKTRADDWPEFPVVLGYGSICDLYSQRPTKKERRRLERAMARRIPIGFHRPPKGAA